MDLRIINNHILKEIDKEKIDNLKERILEILPLGTRVEVAQYSYDNWDQLGGARAESLTYRFFDKSKKIGYCGASNIGYPIGNCNVDLSEEYLELLMDHLKDSDEFWYRIFESEYPLDRVA